MSTCFISTSTSYCWRSEVWLPLKRLPGRRSEEDELGRNCVAGQQTLTCILVVLCAGCEHILGEQETEQRDGWGYIEWAPAHLQRAARLGMRDDLRCCHRSPSLVSGCLCLVLLCLRSMACYVSRSAPVRACHVAAAWAVVALAGVAQSQHYGWRCCRGCHSVRHESKYVCLRVDMLRARAPLARQHHRASA